MLRTVRFNYDPSKANDVVIFGAITRFDLQPSVISARGSIILALAHIKSSFIEQSKQIHVTPERV